MHHPAAAAALSDEQLMRSVQADDDRAFELLYDRYQHRAWQVARLLCRRGDRAERVVQDAFVDAWRERGQYRANRDTVHAWTVGLVYRRAAHGSDSPEAAESDDAERNEAVELLGLLARLPAPQKETIVLAFYGGLTHIQIAELLGLPAETIKGRMRLGLHKLHGVIDVQPQADRGPG